MPQARLWSVSVVTVLALTAYNIIATLQMLKAPKCPQAMKVEVNPIVAPQCKPPTGMPVSLQGHQQFDLKLARWDTSLKFKILDHFIKGDLYTETSEEFLVCLATQSSVERLSSLVEVSQRWSGPMSVALFAAGDEELRIALAIVHYLRICFPSIRTRAAFHLIYPINKTPTNVPTESEIIKMIESLSCANPNRALDRLLQNRLKVMKRWREINPYPQNHLRNVARKNCINKYVFLTDIDIIPSKNMAEKLQTFFQKPPPCETKCVYVVTTYELDQRVKFPENKSEIVRLSKKKLARPFHEKVFVFNQLATNFSKWESNTTDGLVHISHEVPTFDFNYEPFYISEDIVPPHDERFLGYGFTRNTQAFETMLAGYKFLVLSPVFTCHWGFQSRSMRPHWREHQNAMNYQQMSQFRRELKVKYMKEPIKKVKPKSAMV